ncbi:glycosyltransferase [Desulfoscipio gibsoniae]|uniref:Glycosyltransferase n=1 Tax=Desulfoscipio gibsoniae DSM 7213 TaxID=767817 RepID=R4KDB7_9FIRM|nr:glycosyltransferase [Desulfoscipio gibsoniae]AGL01183.1 glycosyltransferase [Desulfoscipio gibsoniae DSM 7213]
MELVATAVKKYEDYMEIINTDTKAQLDYFVNKLQGKKIAMVNATSYGGGVAEILHSMVPLARDMGLNIDWWVIKGADDFYNVTKAFHNCLQGEEGILSPKDKKIYLKYNELNAAAVDEWDYDFIIIHDPQPAALIEFMGSKTKEGAKWVWRCHIDTSTPNPDYWRFLYNYIKQYDACIFTMEEFVQEKERLRNLTFITPSIDPLSTKNVELDVEDARQIIARFGVDIHRPLITQISRFDPWKDPLGVIDTYKIVKKEYPSVQLALVGSMASDDPEGWDYLYRTLRRAGEDYDIKVITNFNGVSNREVNAFQTASDVILQKSLREGFGLTVSEGLWKGTPVIGGNVGGIKYQIIDGVTGYLVDTVEECAEKVLRLLRNPTLAQEMMEAGRERVRQHFLITTHLLNYLKLLDKLEG